MFTGTHHAVRAIVAQQLATYGYTTIGAMNYMSTMAQAAAPLADDATIAPADGTPDAEHTVRQGEAAATLSASGVVPLAVEVANPDVFPESNKPVVAAGDAVLQGIERA